MLKNLELNQLKQIKSIIDKEVKEKEKEEIERVTEKFFQIWEEMEELGMTIHADEIMDWEDFRERGVKIADVTLEINGKEIRIYE